MSAVQQRVAQCETHAWLLHLWRVCAFWLVVCDQVAVEVGGWVGGSLPVIICVQCRCLLT